MDKDYQYSVDELMESPEDFKNDDVHLRGEVVIGIVDDGNNLFLLSGEVEEIHEQITRVGHEIIPECSQILAAGGWRTDF